MSQFSVCLPPVYTRSGQYYGLSTYLVGNDETIKQSCKYPMNFVRLSKLKCCKRYIGNTPGARGWSRLRDRTLAVKSRKKRKNLFLDIPSCRGVPFF